MAFICIFRVGALMALGRELTNFLIFLDHSKGKRETTNKFYESSAEEEEEEEDGWLLFPRRIFKCNCRM